MKGMPHESSNIQQGWSLYEPKLSGPGIGLLDKRSEADITRPTGISFFSYPLRQKHSASLIVFTIYQSS
jgi:hypothetical protein